MIDLGPPPFLFPKPAIIRPATAEMLRYGSDPVAAMLPGMVGVQAGGRRPSAAYVGSNSSTANATTYDFGNFNMPAAGLAIVTTHGSLSSVFSVTEISIGGVAGEITTSGSGVGMGYRVVGSGNQNVTVTFGAASTRAACGVWLLTNYNNIAPIVDAEAGFASGITEQAIVGANIPYGAVCIVTNRHLNTGATAWANATERYDLSLESAETFTGAEFIATAFLESRTFTPSWSGSTSSEGTLRAWL